MKKSEADVILQFMEMTVDMLSANKKRIDNLECLLIKRGELPPPRPSDEQEKEAKLISKINKFKARRIVW